MPENCNVQVDPSGDVLSEEVIVETINTTRENAADLNSIRQNQDNLGDVTVNSIDCNTFPTITGLPMIIIETTAPSVIPSFIGQIYIDKTNKKVYIGINTNNVSDFVVLN